MWRYGRTQGGSKKDLRVEKGRKGGGLGMGDVLDGRILTDSI